MKRKVIKQANRAYTITLPIDWVRKNRISKDSEVDVEIKERSLIINTQSPTEGGSCEITLDKISSKNMYRHIAALYAKGIDEIIINSKEDISSSITYYLVNMMGYALIFQENDKFVIKDIGGGNYQNLDEIFKRVFQVIINFCDSAIKDVFGKEKEKIASLKRRDTEVNKFCLFLQRAVNKLTYSDPINGRILFTYSFALEKIGDEIQRMWRTNIKYDVKKTKEIYELAKLMKEGLEESFDLYYQFKSTKAEKIYEIRDTVRTKSLKLTKTNPETVRFIRHIVKIIEDATDLNHLTIMRKLQCEVASS